MWLLYKKISTDFGQICSCLWPKSVKCDNYIRKCRPNLVKCDNYISKFRPISVEFAYICAAADPQIWLKSVKSEKDVSYVLEICGWYRQIWLKSVKSLMICQNSTDFGQICSYLLQTCGQYCQIWPKWVESVNDLCQFFGQFRSNVCGWHPQIWPKSGELYQPFLKSDQNRSDILLQSTFCLLNLSYFPFFTDEIYLSSFWKGLCQMGLSNPVKVLHD